MAISYDRAGRGEPLLLLHSLGTSRRAWEPVLPKLEPSRDVIAVDLPGFGDSPVLDNTPTPRALAAAVAELLDELGFDRVHVAGNSLGGWVALELERLGRARSVTAIAPAGLWRAPLGPRPGPNTRTIARGLRPFLPLLLRSARVRHVALLSVVAYPERVPTRAANRLVSDYLSAPGFDAANAAMRSAVFTPRRTSTPVTLAWPEHDRLVSRPLGLPTGYRSTTLPGCGHMPMWDDPELVGNLLLEGSEMRERAA